MLIELVFEDVNSEPIEHVFLTVIQVSKDGSTKRDSIKLSINKHQFESIENLVSLNIATDHEDYSSESLTLIQPDDWLCNSSIWTIARDGNKTNISVTLSRIRVAPTEYIPEESISNFEGRPKGVLLEKDSSVRLLGINIEDYYNGKIEKLRSLKNPSVNDPNLDEWDRFFYTESSIDPSQNGNFIWLEYGNGSGKGNNRVRFLVALWVPKTKFNRGSYQFLGSLDFIVFFSPSTRNVNFPSDEFPYTANYPYQLMKPKQPDKGKRSTEVRQPYVGAGHLYLFSQYFFSYQLLASGKKAVLVMPIFPPFHEGEWGPFASQSGLMRLLKEVCHFLHKQLYTTHLYSLSDSGFTEAVSFNNKSKKNLMAQFSPIPQVGRVITSSLSAGIGVNLKAFRIK